MKKKEHVSYSSFIKEKFIKYAMILVVTMYLMFLLFITLNIAYVTVSGTKTKNQEINQWLGAGFTSIEEELHRLSDNPTLIQALQGDRNREQATKELLYQVSNSHPIGNTFVLVDHTNQVVATNLYKSNQTIFSESLPILTLQSRLKEEPGLVEYSTGELAYGFGQKGSCTFGVAVGEKHNLPDGYLFFSLKDASLKEKLLSYHLDAVAITDQFDNILLSTQLTVPDPMEKYPTGRLNLEYTSSSIATSGGIRYFVNKTTFYNQRFNVYTMASIDYQLQMLSYGSILLFLTSILFILFISVILGNMTKNRVKEIDSLVEVAEHIGGGDLTYQAEDQQFEEFQVLSDALNLLSQRLQQMIKDNEELAEHKRYMELKQLESQFNPHFMFNTLETIRYQISVEPKEAEEMVLRFANLMRYSMHYGSTLVPLNIDVSFLEDYLSLQKMRFGERLNYRIDIPASLLEKSYPKLLLQPIVENVMNHGTKRKKYVDLSITGEIIGETAVFKVQDTGDGMSPRQLEKVRELLQKEPIDTKKFGLYSVHRTIQLTYGNAYGVQLDSEENKGTTIELVLPLSEEGLDV